MVEIIESSVRVRDVVGSDRTCRYIDGALGSTDFPLSDLELANHNASVSICSRLCFQQ